MGCGASSEGGGEPGEFKPKKGARCMAPCAWDGDEPHVAIISKVEEPAQGTGDSTTYEVYFPEYEPKLGELPTGTSPEAAKEFAEKQKQAIAAKLPWTKKVSLKGGFTQDQLTHCPFPRRLGACPAPGSSGCTCSPPCVTSGLSYLSLPCVAESACCGCLIAQARNKCMRLKFQKWMRSVVQRARF